MRLVNLKRKVPHKEYNRLRKQRQLHQSHLQPLHLREAHRNCLRLSLGQDLKLLHLRREAVLKIIRRLHHPTRPLPLRRRIPNTEDGIVIALLERIADSGVLRWRKGSIYGSMSMRMR
jgi:hypothetical protein